MDRPALPKQADRPSDEGLMTLSRGLGLGLDAARSASAPSSSASAPPAAASTAAKKDADEIVIGRAAAFVVGRESDGSQDAGSLSNGAERRATAGSSASAAATGTNRMPTTPTAPAASSSLASSSYQRRMPVSPLSRSLIDDVSDVDGPGAAFVRSPPSTSPSSTSPPSKTRHAPNSGFAAHDRSTTRSSRPMALPAPPPPPASQNRAAGGQTPLKSPCFVHGNLGHSVTLQDWLERRPQAGASGNGAAPQGCEDVAGAAGSATVSEPSGVDHEQRPLQNGGSGKGKGPAGTIVEEDEGPSSAGAGSGYDTDGPEGESLTRQLAETAVGVREMSKQLGRTRVRSNIQSILIITKARDNRLIKLTRELAIFLMSKPRAGSGENRRGHTVYVDAQLRHSKRFDAAGIKAERPEFFVPIVRRRSSSSASVNTLSGSVHGSSDGSGNSNGGGGEGQLRYWTSDMCAKSPHLFDFVVTLGGDGTVLFTSWLFQKIVPPVLPFALGSLGFLTNFDFADYASVMSSAIDSGIRVNLRMRFTCTVYRAIRPEDNAKGLKAVRKVGGEILMSEVGKAGWEALEGANAAGSAGTGKEAKRSEKEIMCFSTRPVETFEVLNDLVVDRGPSPYVSMLELFGDEHHMTTVQADGLTISTPTGSTAYSLSAGGSLVHPEIPAILITPICPHTLSFRPMLLPDSMELRICVPYNSRSTAWASFDGRGRVELKQGDHIKVTASQYPFPTVCADKQSTDWFQAIQRTLRWNDREKQKSFVFVEEPRQQQPAPRPLRPPSSTSADDDEPLATPRGGESRELGLEHVDPSVDEDEDEETFDIDDSSTAAASSMNSPPQTPQSQAAVEPTFADGLASAQESHQRAQEPSSSSATSDDGRLPSKSGIQTPGRFADPLSQPHPAKLNIRHIVGALSTLDGSGGPVSNRRRGQHPSSKPPALKRRSSLPAPIKVVPRPEGEEGQRDDIHNPTAQRASKSKIPRSSEREQSTAGTASADVSPTPRNGSSRAAAHLTPESYAAAGQTPKPHERMRRHGSPRHHHSRHAGEQVSPGQDAFAVAPGGQGDRAGKSSGRAFAFFGADESESDSGLSGSDDN